MKVEIINTPFVPLERLAEYQKEQAKHLKEQAGATSVFIGTMRDSNAGEAVLSMQIEHYPGMTESYILGLATEASRRFELLDMLVVHRVGEIFPGQAILLLANWASHRKAACEAERQMLEALKGHAPFWKKEQLRDRSRWVEKNTPGATAPD